MTKTMRLIKNAMTNKMEVTTNDLMNALVEMQTGIKKDITRLDQKIDSLDQKINRLDEKFESKFDLLFNAIGDLSERFTVIDYKFLQLKRQFHTA